MSEVTQFTVLALNPAGLGKVGLAAGAARAGGVGLLDISHCPPGAMKNVDQELSTLAQSGSENGGIGLRLGPQQAETARTLLKSLAANPHWILAHGFTTAELGAFFEALDLTHSKVLFEVTSLHEAQALSEFSASQGITLAGVVGAGWEGGSWVSKDSALVLLQRLLAWSELPVFLRGALGPRTAAACRIAGAAGVVLGDELLLMSESPLPPDWRALLGQAQITDSQALGDELGLTCRALIRPDLPGGQALLAEASACLIEDPPPSPSQWRQRAERLLGWGDPQDWAWPIGQGLGLAGMLRQRHGTTGRLVRAIMDSDEDDLLRDKTRTLLGEDSPLARAHGTRWPLVQGPMAHVSDVPGFAQSVAEAGALPCLALSTLHGPAVSDLLRQTQELMQGRSWGVGLLGFLPDTIWRDQQGALSEVRPAYAVVAGGRPDQARNLEALGIKAYLHVPTSELLGMYLEQGARSFVLEGWEAGGHVGPLASLTLWEAAAETLLSATRPATLKQVSLLLAGGIHDRRSAALAMAVMAPLADAGVMIGLQMGTAYLFCREAVETGAISKAFQEQALACQATMVLPLGPGHANRVCQTPFSLAFSDRRRDLLRQSMAPGEVGRSLEEYCRGRLCIASKGLDRDKSVSPSRQIQEGMFLIGQTAALRKNVLTMSELHQEVCLEGSRWLASAKRFPAIATPPPAKAPSEIAIIGMSVFLPGANDLATYWQNIAKQRQSIREVPETYWDWRLFYDSENPRTGSISSKWGGFLDDVEFNPLDYGIPPKALLSISVGQLLSLEATQRALLDAGYAQGGFDRTTTAVIFAASQAGGILDALCNIRSTLRLLSKPVPQSALERLPYFDEESLPGVLDNVVAGRIANRFDLGGPNYTVDGACASSLHALGMGVRELESGLSSLAIVGGVEVTQTPGSYAYFSAVQALSPQGRVRAFDQAADGTVMSEGAVAMVLKRLPEAVRDGDRIYAVIRGVGSSSDGRAMGLTAPSSKGQHLALSRAYARAGCTPRDMRYFEAHATGTTVGDRTECRTLVEMLRQAGAAPHSCALGSVKSLIGHTKVSAGLAGVAKAALALRFRALPPQGPLDRPLDTLAEERCPLALYKSMQPWLEPEDRPRRAAVSAFGFGGTNVHVVLEEHRDSPQEAALGGDDWPVELFTLSGRDKADLVLHTEALEAAIEAAPLTPPRSLAYSLAVQASESPQSYALWIVVEDLNQLRAALGLARSHLSSEHGQPLPPHIICGPVPEKASGNLAFLFPGQGVQYPGMAREGFLYLPAMRRMIEQADRILDGLFSKPLSNFVLPPGAFSAQDERLQREALSDPHLTQPAVGAVSAAYLEFLSELGLQPTLAAGHSYGEYTALFASGSLQSSEFLRLSEQRGKFMAQADGRAGGMAAVRASRAEVELLLKDFPGLVLANHNAPRQVVVSGERRQVTRLVEHLQSDGTGALLLGVGGAFHSPLMEPAQRAFSAALAQADLRPPRLPVYSNVTAAPHASEPEAIKDLLQHHLLRPVEWAKLIERMHADGARIFLEVGPKAALSKMVDGILADKEHLSLSVDGQGGGLRGLLLCLARLQLAGVCFNLKDLFKDRSVELLNLKRLQRRTGGPNPIHDTWLLNGMCPRPSGSVESHLGHKAFLNLESPPLPEYFSSPAQVSSLWQDVQNLPPHESGLVHAIVGYQDSMRTFLEAQDRMLTSLLGGAPATEPHHSPPGQSCSHPARWCEPASPPKVEATSEVPPALPVDATGQVDDFASFVSLLQSVISERTGYPPEMLGAELDLEAELGVDSIKRMEVLGVLRNRLPEALAGKISSIDGELARARTLTALAGLILGQAGEPTPLSKMPAPQTEVTCSPDESTEGFEIKPDIGLMQEESVPLPDDSLVQQDSKTGCPRFIMRPVNQPLPNIGIGTPEGLFIITADQGGVAQLIGEKLKRRGAEIGILQPEVLVSPTLLENALTELRHNHGPVRGLVHLLPLNREEPVDSLLRWRQETSLQVKSLFLLLKNCAEDLNRAEYARMGRVLVATSFGGLFGRDLSLTNTPPVGGGCQGMLKTIDLEWPRVLARAVDCPVQAPSEKIAHLLADELLLTGGELEVGYPGFKRRVFAPVPAPLEGTSRRASLEPGWVVLATGGARGITAQCLSSLARPGIKLILVGTSPAPGKEPRELSSLTGLQELRAHFIAQAGQSGEAVSPAILEARARSVLRAREALQNLDRLREAGAEVQYHQMDVRNEDRLAALIQDTYSRHGRLDAFLHGAGVISDKLLVDKSDNSFAQVFDTKADSLFILSQHLRPESLKVLALFSSVAGRFGNRGQADYAAANETLNRMACWLQARWPQVHVISLCWGPWEGVGMASAEVNRQMRRRGYEPVLPEAGAEFLRREIEYGGPGQPEVIAGQGPWMKDWHNSLDMPLDLFPLWDGPELGG